MQIMTLPAGKSVQLDMISEGTITEGTENLLDTLIQDCRYGLDKVHGELKCEQTDDSQCKVTLLLNTVVSDKREEK